MIEPFLFKADAANSILSDFLSFEPHDLLPIGWSDPVTDEIQLSNQEAFIDGKRNRANQQIEQTSIELFLFKPDFSAEPVKIVASSVDGSWSDWGNFDLHDWMNPAGNEPLTDGIQWSNQEVAITGERNRVTQQLYQTSIELFLVAPDFSTEPVEMTTDKADGSWSDLIWLGISDFLAPDKLSKPDNPMMAGVLNSI